MQLSKLLSKAGGQRTTRGETDPEVRSLEYDSRRVGQDSVFFAIRGEVTDGHLHIDEALGRGAVAVVSEREAPSGFPAPWIQVPRIRPFMARMADEFYGRPSEKLQLVGITGTNGKTTTAFIVHSILKQQAPSLLMGTVKSMVGELELHTERTTPEAIDIQKTLAWALEGGCSRGALEASSHALFFYRLYQCRIAVAVFTNLTQDHLDFHKTLEDYFQAKRMLFQRSYNPGLQFAVLNADDPFSRRIEPSSGSRVFRFGLSSTNDVFPRSQQVSVQGTSMELSFLGRTLGLESSLLGEHNVYNIMAAATACSLLGISDTDIREGVRRLESVPGRFEKVESGAPFTVIVDYAHTPHALENVLRLCSALRNGRILCVFGCGGDRDRAKRPLMGAIAARYADLVIVTSDNPRSEPPEKIIQEIQTGIPGEARNYETLVDRRAAIARALHLAGKGDIVLIAGKGHESYQEIAGRRIPFDDRAVVKELI